MQSLRGTNKNYHHVHYSMVSNEFWWVTLTNIKGLYFIDIHILSLNYKVGNRLAVVTWKSLLKMEQYLDTVFSSVYGYRHTHENIEMNVEW